MEIRIRIRHGAVELEVELAGDEAFLVDRLPQVVSELLRRVTSQDSTSAPQRPAGQAPGEPALVSIAGDVRDYWSDIAVVGAQVRTIGLTPEVSGQSDADGRFVMAGQATGGSCVVAVAGPDGYLETTMPLELSNGPTTCTALAVAVPDMRRQQEVIGGVPAPNSALVLVHMFDAAGSPLEMVPLADIALLTEGGRPVGDGPFFFGTTGDIQPQAELSICRALDGRARAAFLNVPPGDHALQLTAPDGAGNLQRIVVPVGVRAGAIVLEARLTAPNLQVSTDRVGIDRLPP